MIKTEMELMQELESQGIDISKYKNNKDFVRQGYLESSSRKSFIKQVERLYSNVESIKKKKGEDKKYKVSDPKSEITDKVDKRKNNGGDNSEANKHLEHHIYHNLLNIHKNNNIPDAPVTMRSWAWRLNLPMRIDESIVTTSIVTMMEKEFSSLSALSVAKGLDSVITEFERKLETRSYQAVNTAFNSLVKKGLIEVTEKKRGITVDDEKAYFSVDEYNNHMKEVKEEIFKKYEITNLQYNKPIGNRVKELKVKVQNELIKELGVKDIYAVFDVTINEERIDEAINNLKIEGTLNEHYFARMTQLAERAEKKNNHKFHELYKSENAEYFTDINKACYKQLIDFVAYSFKVEVDLDKARQELKDYKFFLETYRSQSGFSVGYYHNVLKAMNAAGVSYYRFNSTSINCDEDDYLDVKETECFDIESMLPF